MYCKNISSWGFLRAIKKCAKISIGTSRYIKTRHFIAIQKRELIESNAYNEDGIEICHFFICAISHVHVCKSSVSLSRLKPSALIVEGSNKIVVCESKLAIFPAPLYQTCKNASVCPLPHSSFVTMLCFFVTINVQALRCCVKVRR